MLWVRQWRWRLDSVFVQIRGETHCLCCAAHHEGDVREAYVIEGAVAKRTRTEFSVLPASNDLWTPMKEQRRTCRKRAERVRAQTGKFWISGRELLQGIKKVGLPSSIKNKKSHKNQ